jgi:hypothetical protein
MARDPGVHTGRSDHGHRAQYPKLDGGFSPCGNRVRMWLPGTLGSRGATWQSHHACPGGLQAVAPGVSDHPLRRAAGQTGGGSLSPVSRGLCPARGSSHWRTHFLSRTRTGDEPGSDDVAPRQTGRLCRTTLLLFRSDHTATWRASLRVSTSRPYGIGYCAGLISDRQAPGQAVGDLHHRCLQPTGAGLLRDL